MKRRRAIFRLFVLLFAAAGVFWLAAAAYRYHAEVRAWKEIHTPDAIIGKSASDVIARFGQPYAATRAKDGSYDFLMYKGPYGTYLGISFSNGVATKAGFSSQ